MTYDEEARIAQQVLQDLASSARLLRPPLGDVRGAQVQISGVGYSVHRHGSDLRFHQQTGLSHGEVGRYLIVSVGEHRGGWVLARAVRPPGEYHDGRAAEAARTLVERSLVRLGYTVGTPGPDGRRKTPRDIEADVRAFLEQPAAGQAVTRRPARRRRRGG